MIKKITIKRIKIKFEKKYVQSNFELNGLIEKKN
jgi:hypothetical protein